MTIHSYTFIVLLRNMYHCMLFQRNEVSASANKREVQDLHTLLTCSAVLHHEHTIS